MFKPDVPLKIMRDVAYTPLMKAFLLWAWHCREDDTRCDLISSRQDCALRERSISWYADFFQIDLNNFRNRIYRPLEYKGIIKTEQVGTRNELVYVDFTVI